MRGGLGELSVFIGDRKVLDTSKFGYPTPGTVLKRCVPRLPKKDEPPRSFTSDSTLKGRRIVFVLFNLELGGAERQALILARHLVEHEQAAVEVWGFNKPGPVAQLCEQLGVAWRLIPYPLKSGSLVRFAGLVRFALALRRTS